MTNVYCQRGVVVPPWKQQKEGVTVVDKMPVTFVIDGEVTRVIARKHVLEYEVGFWSFKNDPEYFSEIVHAISEKRETGFCGILPIEIREGLPITFALMETYSTASQDAGRGGRMGRIPSRETYFVSEFIKSPPTTSTRGELLLPSGTLKDENGNVLAFRRNLSDGTWSIVPSLR